MHRSLHAALAAARRNLEIAIRNEREARAALDAARVEMDNAWAANDAEISAANEAGDDAAWLDAIFCGTDRSRAYADACAAFEAAQAVFKTAEDALLDARAEVDDAEGEIEHRAFLRRNFPGAY